MKGKIWTGALGAACWMAVAAHGIQVPLNFAITNSVVNEFGQVLPGTSAASPMHGVPYVEGALIQILEVNSGIFPPDTNGVPHPSNPVVLTARIGQGVDPQLAASGMSSAGIDKYDRSGMTTNPAVIIARVFNKPTLEDSSFYADSQTFTVPHYGTPSYEVFFAVVTATTNALDTTDADEDGLSRSWEKSYSTDPDNPDSDNDGMLDGHEIQAGTDPLDADSLLIMVHLQPHAGDDLMVTWDAVPGKSYQLQFIEDLSDESASFSNINAVVTATGDTASTIVTNGLLNPQAIYRVRLAE
jgi:hypothetical protein